MRKYGDSEGDGQNGGSICTSLLKGENACYVKNVEEEKLRNKMDYVTIADL